MTVGVKICGLTEERGLDACLEYGADWVGFVFFNRSPRHVTADRAAKLLRRMDGMSKMPGRVGLFVEPTDEDIADVLERAPLDILQLYTTPERAKAVQRQFGKEVWLSCPVSVAADLPERCDVNRLLIESRAPKGASRPGGNGLALPWDLTQAWQAPSPWILAGGLNPDNVVEAIRLSLAPAVDVSSGVESVPGVKDAQAVRRFIQQAKAG